MYGLYVVLTSLLLPVGILWAVFRTLIGKDDPKRMNERFGGSPYPPPSKPVLWFHGASIGESLSSLPLIAYYDQHFPHLTIVVTTGTRSSALLMEKRLPPRCYHQYVPLDHPLFVYRFLHHWRPIAGFFNESDFWPNIIYMAARGCPLFLLNGHLSERSFRRWKIFKKTFRSLMQSFTFIFAQTKSDQERFAFFGLKNVSCKGNLKFSGRPLDFNEKESLRLKQATSHRRVWVVSSTHPGEDPIILDIHKRLKEKYPDVLLILIPRHIERCPSIFNDIKSRGLTYTLRTDIKTLPSPSTDVYVVNTLGETGLFYHTFPLVFMAGSLKPNIGGHNILEPARFGCTILFGPYMENNKDMADLLLEYKAVIQIHTNDDLYKYLDLLLSKNPITRRYASRLKTVLKEEDGLPMIIKKIAAHMKDQLS